jgi:SAM-dependent methyltransferase
MFIAAFRWGGNAMTTDITQQICTIWDEDAAVYDRSHSSRRPHVLAAWRATLRRLLPDPPASVLDAGAGTGFVSLMLADLGYQVTAIDISAQMLAVLRSKAARLGLNVRTLRTDVAHPPSGEIFDVIVERDLIWTLPEADAALAAWRDAAPVGRLVLIEASWGKKTSGVAAIQARARGFEAKARGLAHRIQGAKPDKHHKHDNYPQNIVRVLPYVNGIRPAEAVCMVEGSSWGPARFERLSDVERATVSDCGLVTQLLGTPHRWAVSAGS